MTKQEVLAQLELNRNDYLDYNYEKIKYIINQTDIDDRALTRLHAAIKQTLFNFIGWTTTHHVDRADQDFFETMHNYSKQRNFDPEKKYLFTVVTDKGTKMGLGLFNTK